MQDYTHSEQRDGVLWDMKTELCEELRLRCGRTGRYVRPALAWYFLLGRRIGEDDDGHRGLPGSQVFANQAGRELPSRAGIRLRRAIETRLHLPALSHWLRAGIEEWALVEKYCRAEVKV